MAEISVDRILQRRDVDAALYLLQRMLNLDNELVDYRRQYLTILQGRLENAERIEDTDRQRLISTYREVFG